MIRTLARTMLRVALPALGVLLVAIAVLTVALRLALPYLESRKSLIEARLGERVGRPVAIGALDLAWRLDGPELRFDDVSVSGTGARAIRFDELRIDVDLFASLWRRTPVVEELTLLGADLKVAHAGNGTFRLQGGEGGTAMSPRAGSASVVDRNDGPRPGTRGDAGSGAGLAVLDWLFATGRVGLLDSRVTVVDAASGREFEVGELNVRVQNEDDLHQIRVELALPSELGGALEVGIDLEGRVDALADSDGRVYARGTALRLGAWNELWVSAQAASGQAASGQTASGQTARDAVASTASSTAASQTASQTASAASGKVPGATPDTGSDTGPAVLDLLRASLERLDGEAEIEAWGTWRDGRIATARSRVDAGDLVLRAASGTTAESPASPIPLLDRLSTDLSYRDDGPGWTLQADRLELVAGRESTVIEDVEIVRGGRADGAWTFAAAGERLPVALVAHLPRALFAGVARSVDADAVASLARLVATIGTLDPRGTVRDWRLRLEPADDAPGISLAGDLDAVSFTSSGAFPGIDALGGSIRIEDGRGTVALGGEGFTVSNGTASVSVDALDIALDVEATTSGETRLSGRVALARASIAAEALVDLTLVRGRSPHVDVQANYAVDDIGDVPPLLAVGGLPPAVTDWFGDALAGGRAENGEFVWRGQLADFPHTSGNGELRAGFDLIDGSLAFLPDWPVARISRGRVELDGVGLVGRVAYGRLDELDIATATARIDDIRRPRLAFASSGRAELRSLIRFGRDGPLRSVLGEVLAEASGTGRAGLDVALEVPLVRGAGPPLDIDGALFLDGNDVTFGRADLTLTAARGSVGFSESGVRIGNLRASLFGRPVSIDGVTSGTGDEAVTELRLEGSLEASDVLSHYAIPLDRFVSGASHWQVTLSAPHSAGRVREDGVRLLATSDLIGTALLLPAPLEKPSAAAVPLTLSSAFREGEGQTTWRIEHGDDRFRAAIATDAEGLFSFGARFGEGPVDAPADASFRLDGRAPRLAFDAWAGALATLIEDLPESPGGPAPVPTIRATLATDALVAGVQSLGPATVRVTTDEAFVNAIVDNAHLAGSVRYPRLHWERDRVARVRLARIDRAVVDALASAPATDVSEAIDPRTFPAIDAHVTTLDWAPFSLGDVTLSVRPDPRGITYVLRGAAAGTRVQGEGAWLLRTADEPYAERPGRHASTLVLALTGDDFGAGLAASGLPGVLTEGRGEVRASLGWEGPLYVPAIERTRGSLSIDLERGWIVPLEPGAGRLVGLFALQALPRRLVFDFRDLTSDGLAFERIEGDVTLAAGVADVALVQLTGPIGVVDVIGTSDIVRREYDQQITVLPRVSAALPIIGAIAAGTSGGIGALVVGGFLKAMGLDVDRIGLRRYALTGSWDDPALTPLTGPAPADGSLVDGSLGDGPGEE